MSIITELKKLIDESDAIVIGAGAGLSTAAGFEYGGQTFLNNFQYMKALYGYNDMYSAGFHKFSSLEEKWGYWSKMIYLNRYKFPSKQLYVDLLSLIKNKNYFVITTNVDHQFQLAGFDKKRLFYMQGDYGLFQCSRACHNRTYDNREIIMKMLKEQKNHLIPSSLIPRCPICGSPMETNLRKDEYFVEDEGWHNAYQNYQKFISENKNKKVLYLELGVGYSTPTWIKYPFILNTYKNIHAHYAVIDKGYSFVPDEIKNRSLVLNTSIEIVIDKLKKI